MAEHSSRVDRLALAAVLLFAITLFGLVFYNAWLEGWDRPDQILLNGLVLAVPLAAFYGGLWVLTAAWSEQRRRGQVSPSLARAVQRTARTAALLLIFMLSLFALDVLDIQGTPLELLGAFILHSLPAIALLAALALAWRWSLVGALIFLLGGLAFAAGVVMGLMPGLLVFAAPLLVIAALFYSEWLFRKSAQPASPTLLNPS